MSGHTGFSTGLVRKSMCYIPIETLMQAGSRKVEIRNRVWLRLVALNRQPDFVNEENRQRAIERVNQAEQATKDCADLIKKRISKQNHLKRVGSSTLSSLNTTTEQQPPVNNSGEIENEMTGTSAPKLTTIESLSAGVSIESSTQKETKT